MRNGKNREYHRKVRPKFNAYFPSERGTLLTWQIIRILDTGPQASGSNAIATRPALPNTILSIRNRLPTMKTFFVRKRVAGSEPAMNQPPKILHLPMKGTQ